MGTVVLTASVAVFVWAVVGLIRPTWARLPSRAASVGVWFLSVVLFIIGGALMPDSTGLIRLRQAFVLALLALATVGCVSDPREIARPGPPEWLLPVPAGTQVISYLPVLTNDRGSQRIELVEDLTIGALATDPEYAFGYPSGIAVDEEGRIYVLDRDHKRIQVFNHDGEHVRTIGSVGQGPGEFQLPRAVAVAERRIYASDSRLRRLNVWNLDGVLEDSVAARLPSVLFGLQGLDDGTVVGKYEQYSRNTMDVQRRIVVARFDSSGTELHRFAVLPVTAPVYERFEEGRVTFRHALVRLFMVPPNFAAGPDGTVYLMVGDAYQILALDKTGEALWALHVAWPNQPLAEEDIETAMTALRARAPEATRDAVRWPEHQSSISGIRVDGAGRLYVYPGAPGNSDERGFPVDVYSPEGELIFSGLIEAGSWRAAWRDYVYGVRTDAQGEATVVRYRLETPF